ncbi:MAG: hypothetical protein KC561_07295 [Myxococcales bacterium]|nr:hypothetical protein [Myxococcales bacterium]
MTRVLTRICTAFLIALGGAALSPACAPDSDEAPSRHAMSEAPAPTRQANTTIEVTPLGSPLSVRPERSASPIRPAGGTVFGAPLPHGAEVVERSDGFAQFRTRDSIERLTEFYRRELVGYDSTIGGLTVRFEANTAELPDIYVVDRGDQREIRYFLDPPEGMADTEPAQDDVTEPGRRAEVLLSADLSGPDTPWPQGPQLDADQYDAARAEEESSPFITRIEYRNGVRTEVQTSRRSLEIVDLTQPPQQIGRALPSTGNHHAPHRDRYGRVVPTYGGTRVQIPRGAAH